MNKDDLLRYIAEIAYNVGFGAKKHFATFDLVSKVPGIIGLVSAMVGVFGLAYNPSRWLSATFAALGFIAYYVSQYEHRREKYCDAGTQLTEHYNELKKIYLRAKSASEGENLDAFEQRADDIQKAANKISVSEQIVFSDWYAHYKFFWQHQIMWIDKELQFKLFRDKLPLSLILFTIAVVAVIGAWLIQ